ncbi:hypothetical protein BLNAU_2200 [Blattamonas nauphoetae]|uniref:Uncharacterized protein n=1 Tax=Blattamonas nauphoetae TaxID=2049346 RepID=A0ABQ9YG87_9EUKA|nr:hypothetical protein BLNAU_2200 [Blattamonas nauphoetae]
MYGRDFFPYAVLAILFGICLLIFAQVMFESFSLRKCTINWKKFLFCFSITFFLSFRVAGYVVPIPYGEFSCDFLNQQIPHYLLCLSWVFMAIWLSGSIFPSGIMKTRTKIILYVSIIVILVILFGISLGISIYVQFHEYNPLEDPPLTLITNCLLYSTINVSIVVVTSQLFRLTCLKTLPRALLSQIKILASICAIMLFVYMLRLVYSVLRLFQVNPFQKFFNTSMSNCIFTGKCIVYASLVACFQVVWEVIPTFLLIVMLFSLQRASRQQRKSTKKKPKTNRRKKKDRSSLHYSSSFSEASFYQDEHLPFLINSEDPSSYETFMGSYLVTYDT